MRNREVSPRLIAAAVLVTLTVVLALYWRGLLTEPDGGDRRMMGGGGGMPPPPPLGHARIEVTTLAGRPLPGHLDGPGSAARFSGPAGVAVVPEGQLYVADSQNHRIRRVSPTGEVQTVAGSGPADAVEGGYQDGPALAARFWNPAGLALAPNGALYVADAGNHCIRVLHPEGRVSTLAGRPGPPDAAGIPAGGYQDGRGPQARFSFPTALALDGAGVLYVADTGNHCIRRVTADGQVSTLAGRPEAGHADGPGTTARFHSPCGVACGPDGVLYVADAANRCVRAISPDGRVSTVPTPRMEAPPPQAEWTRHPDPTGDPAPAGPRLVQPVAVAVDSWGRLCIGDAGVHCLYQVNAGALFLAAGIHSERAAPGWADGGGDRARFARPAALAAGPDGTLYVADCGNHCVRRVTLLPPEALQPPPGHGRPRRGRRGSRFGR
ncbi:MAG: hypothetical protein GX774_06010 [Armatimonadetes bacterium]|nr:hypothetical protein [Armatimonadota bacterium]